MLTSIFRNTGKYRFLVISIAFFLVFDLGVLGLNFYTSGKIAEQTERINLAGRQRTLTQQMSKATLYLKAQKLQNWVYQSGIDELTSYYTIFGDTLELFDEGGVIVSNDTGKNITIKAVEDQEGRKILNESIALWRQFENVMLPLLVDSLVTDEEIVPASQFIAENNLVMFGLMNQLTEHFTILSERQTNFLRMVQVIGILLATINFFIILFHFIRQLRERDDRIELKQHESNQILSTIAEGVFLVDRDMVIGSQYSSFLKEIFKAERVGGRNFERFLTGYFTKKTVQTAVEYVELFFKKHINTQLIADVNPLKSVKALIPNEDNEVVEKYLDFSFALIRQDSGESVVLVTVNDVTDSVLLEHESEKVEVASEVQMVMLSRLIGINRADLAALIDEFNVGYEYLNRLLKNTKKVSDNYIEILSRLFRETHKLKGSASMIGLPWIVDGLHEFEDLIESLQNKSKFTKLSGKALLPLTIKLNSMYEKLDEVKFFAEQFNAHDIRQNINMPSAVNQSIENKQWYDLKKMACRLGREQGVSVDVHFRGLTDVLDSRLSDKLLKMSVQLVRNSIAHGFESDKTRSKLKKPNAGQISISLSHDSNNNYRLVYEDDGRGFDYDAIRKTLIERGTMSEKEVNKLSKTKLVRRSFSESFSTQKDANTLAGRGVGLSLVWNQVKQLGGGLKIRSVEKEFTQFIIDFSTCAKSNDLVLAS